MKQKILRFLVSEDGPTSVEYAVLLALIVAVCLGAVNAMANGAASSFDDSASQISAAFGS